MRSKNRPVPFVSSRIRLAIKVSTVEGKKWKMLELYHLLRNNRQLTNLLAVLGINDAVVKVRILDYKPRGFTHYKLDLGGRSSKLVYNGKKRLIRVADGRGTLVYIAMPLLKKPGEEK